MRTLKAIDLFAGAGGFTTGSIQAGVPVIWVANHWKDAVQIHSENYPNIIHLCESCHEVDWNSIPDHDILLASPACQGNSRAKGKPRLQYDADRWTAWSVIASAEGKKPKVIVVENVIEFRTWTLYPAWKKALELLGYHVTENVLDSSEFGVPQSRERLFVIASRKRPIEIQSLRTDPIPARSIIDLDSGSWGGIEITQLRKPRSPAILEQIRQGRKRFGRRFLVAYYGNEKAGRSLDKPIGTLTTRDTFAIVDGDRMRFLTPSEIRLGMGFPKDYILPSQRTRSIHMLGNAVCPPVAREVIRQIKKEVI